MLNVVKIYQDNFSTANTSQWKKPTNWMEWFTYPKIIKMFNKSFKGITETDWTLCPKTTNAEDAQKNNTVE